MLVEPGGAFRVDLAAADHLDTGIPQPAAQGAPDLLLADRQFIGLGLDRRELLRRRQPIGEYSSTPSSCWPLRPATRP
jgi:hypothetical protein